MKQMWFSGMMTRSGHEVMEDEEQAFFLAFRDMVKDINSITTEISKGYMAF